MVFDYLFLSLIFFITNHTSEIYRSKVKFITFLSRMLLNLAGKHQVEFQKRYPRSREQRQKSHRAGLKSYIKVVDLIEAGKVEEAVAHWRLHLTNANATWTSEGEGARVVDSLGH